MRGIKRSRQQDSDGRSNRLTKIPPHTFLYTIEKKLQEPSEPSSTLDVHGSVSRSETTTSTDCQPFYIKAKDALAAASQHAKLDGAPYRVLEYQTTKAFHVSVTEIRGPVADIACLSMDNAADGFKCKNMIFLRDPSTLSLRLVDDDKKPGVSQQFITDLFASLSLRSRA